MTTHNFKQIHDAFTRGDLDALRAAVADPAAVPHGPMPVEIGSCLVYAIYHSPLPFVRTLLEIGADPNAPADDGFPPLIAALACTRDAPGSPARQDINDLIRLLLASGADHRPRGAPRGRTTGLKTGVQRARLSFRTCVFPIRWPKSSGTRRELSEASP